MAKVTVYSTPSCPWCHKAKDFFKENKIEFVDKDYLAPHFTAEELKEMKVGSMASVIIELQFRRRKPKGKEEEELFRQILEAEAKGYTLHLPLE